MITREQIEQIGRVAAAGPLSETLVGELRRSFPGIHFTYCMDDDVMAGRPIYEDTAFNIYLVDSSNHCLAFTRDLETATGVAIAEIEDQ